MSQSKASGQSWPFVMVDPAPKSGEGTSTGGKGKAADTSATDPTTSLVRQQAGKFMLVMMIMGDSFVPGQFKASDDEVRSCLQAAVEKLPAGTVYKDVDPDETSERIREYPSSIWEFAWEHTHTAIRLFYEFDRHKPGPALSAFVAQLLQDKKFARGNSGLLGTNPICKDVINAIFTNLESGLGSDIIKDKGFLLHIGPKFISCILAVVQLTIEKFQQGYLSRGTSFDFGRFQELADEAYRLMDMDTTPSRLSKNNSVVLKEWTTWGDDIVKFIIASIPPTEIELENQLLSSFPPAPRSVTLSGSTRPDGPKSSARSTGRRSRRSSISSETHNPPLPAYGSPYAATHPPTSSYASSDGSGYLGLDLSALAYQTGGSLQPSGQDRIAPGARQKRARVDEGLSRMGPPAIPQAVLAPAPIPTASALLPHFNLQDSTIAGALNEPLPRQAAVIPVQPSLATAHNMPPLLAQALPSSRRSSRSSDVQAAIPGPATSLPPSAWHRGMPFQTAAQEGGARSPVVASSRYAPFYPPDAPSTSALPAWPSPQAYRGAVPVPYSALDASQFSSIPGASSMTSFVSPTPDPTLGQLQQHDNTNFHHAGPPLPEWDATLIPDWAERRPIYTHNRGEAAGDEETTGDEEA